MAILEYILEDNIFIDFGAEIHYGSDQMYVTYPIRFATVEFELMSTGLLAEIADRIRKDKGFIPMHPMDEYTDETCDQNGWYDFYIGINDLHDCRIDTCITFFVVNSDSPDNEEMYTIDLSPEEQGYFYCRLDEQCKKYIGKSCEDLLVEARKEMDI